MPADRPLVYEITQGWEPLCAFLGVPVPDEPFPRVNDAVECRRWQRRCLARLLGPAAAVGLAAAVAVAAGLAAAVAVPAGLAAAVAVPAGRRAH